MTQDLRSRVRALCTSLPGARATEPFGPEHEAWKVGDKMFACFGAVDPGVSVKTAGIEAAELLIEAGIATKARYFHRSWVRLPDDVADDELAHRVLTSYDIVRAGLTKKVQATLAPRPIGAE